MAGNRDPQRRPVLYDLKNQRFLADPAIGSTYYPINLGSGSLTSSDIGVTVQGYDATLLNAADIGVTVQGYDATLLNAADIGVTVQGYDATLLNAADIGVTVQGYDADLSAIAALSTTGLISRTGAGTVATVASPSGDLVGTTATQTLTNKTLTSPQLNGATDVNGSYRSNVVSVPVLNIDCSLGNYFTKTISSNSTFTFNNAPASRAYSFVLELTHTSGAVTWPTSVKWPQDVAPVLTAGKTHVLVFVTDDAGSRWRGSALVDYTN